MADLVRALHVRLFFAQDQEGQGDHAVGGAAGKVAGVHGVYQHRAPEERRKNRDHTDEEQRVDRRLVLRVKLAEGDRDHVGLRHGVHGAGSADEKGIPARHNAAQSAYDDDLGHDGGVKCLLHRIGGHKAGRGADSRGDLTAVQDIPDGEDDQCVEADRQNDREDQHLSDLLQGTGDLLRGLRDDIESDEEERGGQGNF